MRPQAAPTTARCAASSGAAAAASATGPRIIGAKLPTDPKEQMELMISGIAGRDVQLFPRYYVPYDEVLTLEGLAGIEDRPHRVERDGEAAAQLIRANPSSSNCAASSVGSSSSR